MKRSSHLRNVCIAVLVTLSILAMQQLPAAAGPVAAPLQQGVNFSWSPVSLAVTGIPGQSDISFSSSLRNDGADETFVIAASRPTGWPAVVISPNSQVVIENNQSRAFTFFISIPVGTAPGSYAIDITAARQSAPSTTSLFRVTVTVQAPTPTTTNTTTPTRTTGPTETPGPVCEDGFEGDNGPASAKALDVNTAQQHAICPAGDEDWLVFGGVAGKVYTIDISRQDPGIDLTLELFDKDLNSIAFNDDYYNRDPANPNPGDTKPRITIRIPFDGPYYVRVRDAAGRGGVNYIYNIALLDESYGPTPTLVREICQDLFEPDGLPEQARLITSNEIQEERRLCPAGDADWTTFFGKAGKRYIIFTDTRRYVGVNRVNGQTQAGADTVMVLTDRDGTSLLDVNDDIPGGSTLDSQIEFTPEVDGFYFVQVKNVGDIGNQFIRYDLTLLLCLAGQTDCGRGDATTTAPVRPITPQPTGTPASDEFTLDPTATPTP